MYDPINAPALAEGADPLVPSRLERFAVALAEGASPSVAYEVAVCRIGYLRPSELKRRAEAWLALSAVRERVAFLRDERLAAFDRLLRLWRMGGDKCKRRRRNGA